MAKSSGKTIGKYTTPRGKEAYECITAELPNWGDNIIISAALMFFWDKADKKEKWNYANLAEDKAVEGPRMVKKEELETERKLRKDLETRIQKILADQTLTPAQRRALEQALKPETK